MTGQSPSTAVDRALSILEALVEQADGLTNSQLSRRLEMPKSSASYVLHALERRGYLLRDSATGRYRLGLRVLDLNRAVLGGLSVWEPALPVLHWLVGRIQITTHLAVLDHGQAVYVLKVDAPGFIKMDTWVGRRMDIHSTSVGKVLVAHLPQQELEAILRRHPLRKRTPKTITVLAKLLRELEKVRARGYAVDDEENNLGARCVGAPVLNDLGEVLAAVGVSGTTTQIDHASLPKIAALVREAAAKVSRQLGYHAAARAG